jgi:ABC-type multidrug transport system fused ATPase/permease subunit
MCAWEEPLCARVQTQRSQEVAIILQAAWLKALNAAIFVFLPVAISSLACAGQVLLHDDFTPSLLFALLTMISVSIYGLAFYVPSSVAHLNEWGVSLNRIDAFLQLPDLARPATLPSPPSSDLAPYPSAPPSGKAVPAATVAPVPLAVELRGACFLIPCNDSNDPSTRVHIPGAAASRAAVREGLAPEEPASTPRPREGQLAGWGRQGPCLELRVDSLALTAGQRVCVCGAVGSGKSMLLLALLGEFAKSEGHVALPARVAYASQKTWLLSASLRENVLFGAPFDSQRYQSVRTQRHACDPPLCVYVCVCVGGAGPACLLPAARPRAVASRRPDGAALRAHRHTQLYAHTEARLLHALPNQQPPHISITTTPAVKQFE